MNVTGIDGDIEQLPASQVLSWIVDLLWDTSSLNIPPDAHAERWIEILAARDDADSPDIRTAIKECRDFLKPDEAAVHD